MSDLTETMQRMVSAARAKADRSPSCVPPNRAPALIMERHGPWSFGLDVYVHNDVEHWRFSAKLLARSSTNEDWATVGRAFAIVTSATGLPDRAPRARLVVLDLLREAVRQAGEAPHAHSHGEVLAMAVRFFGESAAARALPPFVAPSLPSATAAGFFSGTGSGAFVGAGRLPVACRMVR